MEFDYFYGQQAEQFTFYRIPKVLFTDSRFWNVSTDAKLLYGILLDRMNLSARNGWLDDAGRVYIIFTLEETMAALNCGDNKATKLYNELEKKCGLIERKRQGLGKPNLIYVKNFIGCVGGSDRTRSKNRENNDSEVGQIPILESGNSRGNNTDYSNTDPFHSVCIWNNIFEILFRFARKKCRTSRIHQGNPHSNHVERGCRHGKKRRQPF